MMRKISIQTTLKMKKMNYLKKKRKKLNSEVSNGNMREIIVGTTKNRNKTPPP